MRIAVLEFYFFVSPSPFLHGYHSDGVFLAVKEVSLLDEGHRGRTSISHLERVRKYGSNFHSAERPLQIHCR